MALETQPGVEISLPDGTTETWVAGPGIKLRQEAIAEFLRICVTRIPIAIEHVDVPIEIDQ